MSIRKVVLITGCSSGGIGYNLCQEFANRGCTVYATSRRLETMRELATKPGIHTKALDVRDDLAVTRVVKEVISEAGKIDIVVSNAGYLCGGALLDVPVDTVKDVFDTNTYGTLRLAQAVGPHMAERRSGLIVVVGSVVGMVATPWAGIYSASKAALHSLTDNLAMELSPFGVNVLLLVPGSVQSNIAKSAANAFSLPEGSLYTNYSEAIVKRIWGSQTTMTMSTESFVKLVADKALQKNPPGIVRAGGGTFFWRAVAWLPRWVLLRLFWAAIGKTNKTT